MTRIDAFGNHVTDAGLDAVRALRDSLRALGSSMSAAERAVGVLESALEDDRERRAEEDKAIKQALGARMDSVHAAQRERDEALGRIKDLEPMRQRVAAVEGELARFRQAAAVFQPPPETAKPAAQPPRQQDQGAGHAPGVFDDKVPFAGFGPTR